MDRLQTSEAEIKAMQDYLDELLQQNGKSRKPRKERIRSAALSLVILSLLLVLYSVFTARSRGVQPDILGFQLYQIESGSMAPTLEIGDIILSRRPDDAASLAPGDIITFQTEDGTIVTHRIIEVMRDDEGQILYRTQGDSPQNHPDKDPVPPGRILAEFILKLPLS